MSSRFDYLVDYEAAFPKRRIEAGGVIFREGEEAKNAYVVLDGKVQICTHNKKGELVHLTTLRKGQLFGEMALLDLGVRTATAITEEGCDVLLVQREKLLNRLKRADPIVQFWIEYLSERVIDLSKRVKS